MSDGGGHRDYFFNVPTTSLRVVGQSSLFPVRRVWCVGSNYRKVGVDYASRELPYFFSKQTDMVIPDGGVVTHPGTGELRFEVELVIAVGKEGRRIEPSEAERLIFGYGAGLDMTRRDVLLTAQSAGKPWEVGKSFEGSAPVSALTQSNQAWTDATVQLTQNGILRQNSNINQLIWTIPEIISHLSALVTLAPGDLIFTGTPSGHGPCVAGDQIEGRVEGVPPIRIQIRKEAPSHGDSTQPVSG